VSGLSRRRRSASLALTPTYTIAPDGKRFLILVHSESIEKQRASQTATFLLNFTDQLRLHARSSAWQIGLP
jgi:hypothetical protein